MTGVAVNQACGSGVHAANRRRLRGVGAAPTTPAGERVDGSLDLNAHLVVHREATFLIRVHSESMAGAGIHDGDLLVVDRVLDPCDGDIVVAMVDGALTLKRLSRRNGHVRLLPENPCHRPGILADDPELSIWGVATSVVHRLK